jgi:hypothetical protein
MKTIILTIILLAPAAGLTQEMSPLTKYALAYPKQPSDSERNAALRPYQWPVDSLNAILEDEGTQARDLADYPDPMPDSFVIWSGNDRQVTPEQFVEIFRKDMAAYDSLNYEYRKFFVEYRRRAMIQPEMLAMPRGMDYIGQREWKNDPMLSKLIAEIVMRKHPSLPPRVPHITGQ